MPERKHVAESKAMMSFINLRLSNEMKHKNPNAFESTLNEMLKKLAKHLNEGGSIDDIVAEKPIGVDHWSENLANTRSSYRRLYDQHRDFIIEEKRIAAIEAKAAKRDLFFRVLTTIFVGLSIMCVYWLASLLSISMPLMRI